MIKEYWIQKYTHNGIDWQRISRICENGEYMKILAQSKSFWDNDIISEQYGSGHNHHKESNYNNNERLSIVSKSRRSTSHSRYFMIGDKKFYYHLGYDIYMNNYHLNGIHINTMNNNNNIGYQSPYHDSMIDDNMIQTPSNLTTNSNLLFEDDRYIDNESSANFKQKKIWDDKNSPWPEQWRIAEYE